MTVDVRTVMHDTLTKSRIMVDVRTATGVASTYAVAAPHLSRREHPRAALQTVDLAGPFVEGGKGAPGNGLGHARALAGMSPGLRPPPDGRHSCRPMPQPSLRIRAGHSWLAFRWRNHASHSTGADSEGSESEAADRLPADLARAQVLQSNRTATTGATDRYARRLGSTANSRTRRTLAPDGCSFAFGAQRSWPVRPCGGDCCGMPRENLRTSVRSTGVDDARMATLGAR